MNYATRKTVSEAVAVIDTQMEALREALDMNHDADVEGLALRFCRLNDDTQAKFFVAVARRMREWGVLQSDSQAHYIGRHLRTCECSTDDARDLVRNIAAAIESDG